ncbi:RND family efflux transporter MFP subunit [Arcticibacter pallidicorallinus]|uniref:RND family efflux transporter MFP subunit n=1 Tax=Arcticibacter pallidicorallinus TaxID=1259464 RepID=A0A2T0U574_9SPHI|nr:efflux RND transporter periplasmic adaptor subunit [Arcticibacter pallidicorallinus]PRY53071.1 RND family efflux transporter MFP subunit [Arcticibacter pallidicorallinus]
MKPKPYIAVLTLSLAFASCQPKGKESLRVSDAPIPVIAHQVSSTEGTSTLPLSGNVEGYTTVRLGFMVAGKINFISNQEGQKVEKGQLLSSLDPTSYQIAKAQADIQVNQIKDEYQRIKLMFERNSVSQSDFNKVNFNLQQAMQQQRMQAKNLADTRLYSPIAGVLLKKMAETGEIVGVGNPLFVVSDISRVKVSAFIPETELNKVRLGEEAKVYISSLDKTYTGKVTEIGSAADATSRAFTLKVDLDNPGLQIRPGMIAEVLFESRSTNQMLTLPAEAILHDTDNQAYVFVTDSVGQKAYKRNVTVGQLVNNQVEVTSGIQKGELVVTGGQQKLSEGIAISLNK